MARREVFQSKTALITGASSGIGQALAISLSRRGCRLILCDINYQGLLATKDLCDPKAPIETMLLDVGDPRAILEASALIETTHPHLDFLFNNAGVAIGGDFDQISEEDFIWLFDINFWGVVRMSRAFLPLLKKSPSARIINISSLFGIVAPAGHTAYVASKFAVRGFSLALAHELEGSSIGVSVVHPGGIATAIAKNARAPKDAPVEEANLRRKKFDASLRMPPEKAAEIILRGIERRKRRILIGGDARVSSWLERLMPVAYWRILGPYIPR